MYRATVFIKLKRGVLNPEARTIHRALNFLNYDEVKDVDTFKCIVLDIDCSSEDEALNKVKEICDKVLANPVIHNYEIKIEKVNNQ